MCRKGFGCAVADMASGAHPEPRGIWRFDGEISTRSLEIDRLLYSSKWSEDSTNPRRKLSAPRLRRTFRNRRVANAFVSGSIRSRRGSKLMPQEWVSSRSGKRLAEL